MRVFLVNNLVVSQPGTYKCSELSARDFFVELRNAFDSGVLLSRLSFNATADLVNSVCGFRPGLATFSDKLEDGDVILSCIHMIHEKPKPGEVAKIVFGDVHLVRVVFEKTGGSHD